MLKLTAIIVDDEPLAIDTLKWQLEQFCPFVQLKGGFSNPKAAIDFLGREKVDLCLLDINMPEMSGFEFLAHWKNEPPFAVIFTTAYNEFAVKAFRVSAFDYLTKPVDEEELVNTLQNFQRKRQQQSLSAQLSVLANQLDHPNDYPDRLALSTQEGIHIVAVNRIVRLEASSNYTQVYLDDNTSLLLSKSLRQIEEQLDPKRFMRVHQSHTIQLEKIKLYQRGRGGSVLLKDGTLIPVSKHRKEKLLEALGA